jgi:protein tyrosine/serine phosphatase
LWNQPAELSWIELEGAVNARDTGGLPLSEGGATRPGRLLRSDNLQDLTPGDIKILVDELNLRTVVDLRTQFEVDGEGAGPLLSNPAVSVHHLSLLKDWPKRPADEQEAQNQEILPGQGTKAEPRKTYSKYLLGRPDAVVEALKLIAHSDGASLVHCAAGKDRTGVVVALALAEVGVTRDAIVRDYVGDSDRIAKVVARLTGSPTYDWVTKAPDVSKQIPVAKTMEEFFGDLDAEFGGPRGWLRNHSWTEDDAAALRRNLIG